MQDGGSGEERWRQRLLAVEGVSPRYTRNLEQVKGNQAVGVSKRDLQMPVILCATRCRNLFIVSAAYHSTFCRLRQREACLSSPLDLPLPPSLQLLWLLRITSFDFVPSPAPTASPAAVSEAAPAESPESGGGGETVAAEGKSAVGLEGRTRVGADAPVASQ